MRLGLWRNVGRLALVAMVAVFTASAMTGCSQKRCGNCPSKCSKPCDKPCDKPCNKPCDKQATSPCGPGCSKPCCKKA